VIIRQTFGLCCETLRILLYYTRCSKGRQDRPDDRIDNELRAKAINNILDTLDKREKDIIIARFGLNGRKAQTLDEVAMDYKLTKERIRQIEQEALHKLRNPRRLEVLKVHF